MRNPTDTQAHLNGINSSLLQNQQINKFKQCFKNNWKLGLATILILVVVGSMKNYPELPLSIVDEVTFLVVVSGRLDVVQQTLNSIYKTTDLQRTKYIVVYDGNKSQELDHFIQNNQIFAKLNNSTTWIVTGGLIGEIACFDLAFSQVKSPYVFLSMGPWNYTKNNYMENALKLIKSSRDISQVVVTQIDDIFLTNVSKLSIYDTMKIGFNFLPSLHRMKAYHLIEGGLTNLTRNVTFGAGAGSTYGLISMFYAKKGYRVALLNENYAKKIERTNFLYKYPDYKDEYGYKGYWRVKPEQRDTCSVFLDVWSSFRKQSAIRRQIKKQLGNIISLKRSEERNDLQNCGLARNIQIGTQFDYVNITNHPEYPNITDLLPRVLHYEQKLFTQEKKNEPDLQILQPASIQAYSKINSFIEGQSTKANMKGKQPPVKLAALLLQKPKDKKILQAEYVYYAKNYGIDQVKEQLKLCIFVQGYKISQRAKLSVLINSINNQNYSNYQVVFATDENRDYSREQFYGLAFQVYPRVINRLKTSLKNQDIIGTPGNHFVRVNQFCKGTDVVVTLNGNSSLIGNQAFNVINTLFQQKQQTWITFFSPLEQINNTYTMKNEIEVGQNFRKNAVDTDNFLIAYRYGLSSKLPIEYVMEFVGNREDDYLRPAFYESESNVFHIYSYAEMSGSSRMKNFKIPLYLYKQLDELLLGQDCYPQRQAWMKTKALIKYPFHFINSLEEPSQINMEQKYSAIALSKVKQAYSIFYACQNKKQDEPQKIVKLPFAQFVNQSLSNMTVANYYISNFEVSRTASMPFCLIVWAGDQISAKRSMLIRESIQNQHYQNYTLIFIQKDGKPEVVKLASKKTHSGWAQIYNVTLSSQSYLKYKKTMMDLCTENSVVMFVNNPLKRESLALLNNLHQRENSWMTYSVVDNYVQINSFYLRVYELIYRNDFNQTNSPYLEEGDQQLQALAVLELCPKRSSRLREQEVYQIGVANDTTEGVDILYFRAFRFNKKQYKRYTYQYLLNLQQDFKTNLKLLEHHKKLLQVGKSPQSRPFINTGLNKIDLLQAYEYQQIPYLPDNHFLNIRQYENLQRKFQISKYMSGEYKNKLVRFCVTIFGRNNTENDRYLKNLKTVIMQNYSNFHIVFMDDDSDDGTLELSMQYFKKQNFPKDRVTYVRNKQRTFATYNIINAAFNFCGEDDVQVRLDGDDVIVGRNVFGLINSFYQRNPEYYVVYTTFKSSLFTYGMGNEVQRIEEMILCNGGRRRFHFIAPLTTWRVKLVRSIPLKSHKLEYGGGWLNTLYDDALQFSFVDLATIDRIKFIPYFAYNYNTGYGSNDNSDKEKIKNRIAIFQYVITLDKLKPLKDLNDERINNRQVSQQLQEDRGKRWEVVDA